MIEVQLSFMTSVVIEHVTECHDWSYSVTYLVTTQIINSIRWLGLISFSLWFGMISSSLLIQPNQGFSFTRFNHFDSDFIPFTLFMEDGERHSQSHSGEYYWLVPDLTLSTLGRYITIFPVAVVMLTLPVHKPL